MQTLLQKKLKMNEFFFSFLSFSSFERIFLEVERKFIYEESRFLSYMNIRYCGEKNEQFSLFLQHS